MEEQQENGSARRGIYLLPNLFTTAAMFAGFYAIVAAMGGRFEAAAVAVYVAMLLDGVDGRIARWTNSSSEFGAQYDSLSDMVSFGLAPALVLYEWALVYMNSVGWGWAKLGWLAAFFYTAAAALRLARFNTLSGVSDKRYFQGLPSPSAAALTTGMVWVWQDLGIPGEDGRVLAFLLVIAAGSLMVSRFSYYSFKDFHPRHRVSFIAVLAIVLAFMFTAMDPPKVLFTGFAVYALSGPVLYLMRLRRRRSKISTPSK